RGGKNRKCARTTNRRRPRDIGLADRRGVVAREFTGSYGRKGGTAAAGRDRRFRQHLGVPS
ncbi:MAG TPA: hypothetical protein VIX90_03745, partial [Edaphobacter sp.]